MSEQMTSEFLHVNTIAAVVQHGFNLYSWIALGVCNILKIDDGFVHWIFVAISDDGDFR